MVDILINIFFKYVTKLKSLSFNHNSYRLEFRTSKHDVLMQSLTKNIDTRIAFGQSYQTCSLIQLILLIFLPQP